MCKNTNREIEEFRKIPSLKFLYEVNCDGTIIRNVKSKRHLKIKTEYHHTKAGYKVTFCNIGDKITRVMVHKVVAECWLGIRPDGLQIDHINRNSLDNHYTNLRYVTHSEQMKNRVLSQRIIDIVIKNCSEWNKKISIPVIIDGERFESIFSASRYLANLHSKGIEHMRGKLKKRRSNIYGHEIKYLPSLIAETRHSNSMSKE